MEQNREGWLQSKMLNDETLNDYSCCCKRGACRRPTDENPAPVGDNGATLAVASADEGGVICCKLKFGDQCPRLWGVIPYGYAAKAPRDHCLSSDASSDG